jgi:N-acyl homoserine lactone hydrolase
MPMCRATKSAMTRSAVAALFAAFLGFVQPAAAQPQVAQPPKVESLRLYMFDCGWLFNLNPETYNLTRQDVPDPTMPVPCFLVAHPNGVLLYDAGLGDHLIGRTPNFRRGAGNSHWIVFKTLNLQMAEIGYNASHVNYLVISHMHADHVGNANNFAGPNTTWLVQKVEHDAMFAEGAPVNPDYAALKNAKKQLLNGDHDVFGDGSVMILNTPGHTVGHQALFVKLPKTGPVVLSGDLYHYLGELTLKRMPDREKTLGTAESRAKVESLVKETNAQLWIGHELSHFRMLKKSPEYYD